MKCDIILAGVGGQGILTVAYLLDNAAIRRGWHFKQSEVHGMSQRGGAVYSHLRISDGEIISDLVPEGKADLILAVEPLEVQRYLHYLGPKGQVVSSVQPFKNIPDYPEESRVISALLDLPNCILFNAKEIALKGKSPRSENVATVGAALHALPFAEEDFDPILEELFGHKGAQVVDANKAILRMGRDTGLMFSSLRKAGVPSKHTHALVEKLEPDAIDPTLANDFAAAILKNPDTALTILASLTSKVACNTDTLRLFQ